MSLFDDSKPAQVSCLTIVGEIATFSCKDFIIEIVGNQHVITMKVPDPGGYKKVKAQYLIEPIMSILNEDY